MDIERAVLDVLKLVISWPVVVLIVLLVLHKPLGALLDGLIAKLKRLSEATVGSTTLKFVTTPIGQIDAKISASATPIRFGSNSRSFRSEPFGFEISYPAKTGWIESTEEEMGEQTQKLGLQAQGQFIAFLVRAQLENSLFRPNVNVVLQPVGDRTVAEYAADTLRELVKLGAKPETWGVDSATNAASFSYVIPYIPDAQHPESRFIIRCISRVIIPKDLGLAYLATLTTEYAKVLPEDVANNLVGILNSFTVFKTATIDDTGETK